MLDAFLVGAAEKRKKFIPFLIDVQTDRHFLGKVRTVCTFSDASKLENTVNAPRRRWRSSSNAPFVMNTRPIQVIEGSSTLIEHIQRQWIQRFPLEKATTMIAWNIKKL